MKKFFRNFILGKRYFSLQSIDDQVKYATMNFIFLVAMIPLIILGLTLSDQQSFLRIILDFGIAFLCFIALILIRTKIPLKNIPYIPLAIFNLYCIYLLYEGSRAGWAAAWSLAYPIISIFLCGLTFGIWSSSILFGAILFFCYSPWQLGFFNIGGYYTSAMYRVQDPVLSSRFVSVYALIFVITIIYERIRILKNKKEIELNRELVYERDTIQTMKDNMNMGVFLMNTNLLIQPQYSKPLVTILSRYEENLEGKDFLDLLSGSIDTKQQRILRKYFEMIFTKSKSLTVLEEANPISEFEYRIDGRSKFLTTKFQLVEKEKQDSYILAIISDISKEREFAQELEQKRLESEIEMKNLFDVIQIDPLVFEDFILTVENNFKHINEVLKNDSLSSRDVATKFFQNIHAIKSNALILGLTNFGKKLHAFEDEIKSLLNLPNISSEELLHLTFKFEELMKEKDEYQNITKKLSSFRAKNQIDDVLKTQFKNACTKISKELNKIIELKIGNLDQQVLETKLRNPLKDIIFQFIRNSAYHGIENKGIITLSITKKENNAILNYSDNGKGLDLEKIKEKFSKLWPNIAPTNQILINSIFKPEFSTADETSTVAGRGVGLSLVRDLCTQYKGKIAMSYKNGLSFKITFPLEGN